MKKLSILLLTLMPALAIAQAGNKWVSHFSTGGIEYTGQAVETDAIGNVYVTGILAVSPFQSDIITVKYDSLGKEKWTHAYSRSGVQSLPKKLLVDNTGNVYVGGTTVYNKEVWLLYKIDPNGMQLWEDTTQGNVPGGYYNNYVNDMSFSSTGDIIMAGAIHGSNTGAYPYWFINAHNTSGTETWRNHTAVDYAYNDIRKIAAGLSGAMYAAGYEAHGNPPGERFVIRRYSATGVIDWQIIYDADSTTGENEAARDIKTDAAGNLYVAGNVTLNGKANQDYILRKYSAAGALIWSRTYSLTANAGIEFLQSLYVAPNGDAYMTGNTQTSSVDPTQMLTVKFDASGVLQWSRTYNYNPSWPSESNSIDGDIATGNVVITGYTRKTSGSVGPVTIKYASTGDMMWEKVYPASGGVGNMVRIGADHNTYMTGKDGARMVTVKIMDADASLKKNINGPGNYVFDSATKKTGIQINMGAGTGQGEVLVTMLLNEVGNKNWCPGTNPAKFSSRYRWVINQNLDAFVHGFVNVSIIKLRAALSFDPGMGDPTKFSIYQRPYDGQGEFCKLLTTFANDTMSAPITSFSEFFIGSETDSFNYYPNGGGGTTSVTKLTGMHELSVYPNPASDIATISFTLIDATQMNLSIYDVTGRLVKTIKQAYMSKGAHKVVVSTSELQNGIYFCRLTEQGNYTEAIKLSISH